MEAEAEKSGYNFHQVNLEGIFDLLKPRVHRLNEIITQGYYFFTDHLSYDAGEITKKWLPAAAPVLEQIAASFLALTPFDETGSSSAAKEIIQSSGIKMGNIMPVFRAALTGSTQGPDVFAIAVILGKEESVKRISGFREKLNLV